MRIVPIALLTICSACVTGTSGELPLLALYEPPSAVSATEDGAILADDLGAFDGILSQNDGCVALGRPGGDQLTLVLPRGHSADRTNGGWKLVGPLVAQRTVSGSRVSGGGTILSSPPSTLVAHGDCPAPYLLVSHFN